ncbi:MAG: YigZ family protein [Halobacteriales archaeon]
MSDTYRTVEGRGESAFEVRGSEFIGHARPARSVEDAEAFVAAVEEEYADATHNVPAYRVRVGDGTPSGHRLREYERDDSEPTGSAGDPALNVLVQRDVENVAAVVTRYYGGTNLGVGGLARAYSRAVTEAVDDAGVIEREPREEVVVTVAYDDSGTVRGILESAGVDFEAEYAERAQFEALVPTSAADDLRDRLRSATSGRAEVS